jgi:hypothetical protein
MTQYNVLVGVVEVVDATSAEAAIRQMEARLEEAGFDTYHVTPPAELPQAFESEPT